MKQVLTWSLIILVLFIVLFGAVFVGLSIMTPDLEGIDPASELAQGQQVNDSTAVDEPEISPADSMQILIDDLRSKLFFMRIMADSLDGQLTIRETALQESQAGMETLKQQLELFKSKSVSIKDLAKTYETMKVSEIAPILEKVDDATIIALYKNMGSRTRKNLMNALSDVRAAQITKKLAG